MKRPTVEKCKWIKAQLFSGILCFARIDGVASHRHELAHKDLHSKKGHS